jgi:hypothetical protein
LPLQDAHSFFNDSHYGTTNPRLQEVSGKHAQLVFSILYITSADFFAGIETYFFGAGTHLSIGTSICNNRSVS